VGGQTINYAGKGYEGDTVRDNDRKIEIQLRELAPLLGLTLRSILSRATLETLDASPSGSVLSVLDSQYRRFKLMVSPGNTTLIAERDGRWSTLSPPAESEATDRPTGGHVIVSDDRDFLAQFDRDRAIVWTSSGVTLTETLVHRTPILDARFVRRGSATYLQTISTDGSVREWFVFEHFHAKPTWARGLASLNSGSIEEGREGSDPTYFVGASRAAVFNALRAESTPAARAILRHFGAEPSPED
jgi:hypothetical protein